MSQKILDGLPCNIKKYRFSYILRYYLLCHSVLILWNLIKLITCSVYNNVTSLCIIYWKQRIVKSVSKIAALPFLCSLLNRWNVKTSLWRSNLPLQMTREDGSISYQQVSLFPMSDQWDGSLRLNDLWLGRVVHHDLPFSALWSTPWRLEDTKGRENKRGKQRRQRRYIRRLFVITGFDKDITEFFSE